MVRLSDRVTAWQSSQTLLEMPTSYSAAKWIESTPKKAIDGADRAMRAIAPFGSTYDAFADVIKELQMDTESHHILTAIGTTADREQEPPANSASLQPAVMLQGEGKAVATPKVERTPTPDGPFGDYKLKLGQKVHSLNKGAERSWRLLKAFWSVKLEEKLSVSSLVGSGQPWESEPDVSNVSTSLTRFKNDMPGELPWRLKKDKGEIEKVAKSRDNHAT